MAARGINKVIIVGNLGKDPEMRYLPNGDAVANFTVATSETWKDKQTGEQKEQTEWHRIVAFRRLGEICGEYLRKGSKVFVEGRLQTRKWQNQQGQDVYSTEVVANEMQMLDSRGQSGAMGSPSMGQQPMGFQAGQPPQAQSGNFQPAQGGAAPGGGFQPASGAAGGQGGFHQSTAPAMQGGGFQPQQQPPAGQGGFQPAANAGQTGFQSGGAGQGAPAPVAGQGGFQPAPNMAPQGGGKPQGQAPVEPPIDFDDDIPF